ncbi:unnamed protein product [Peniophora sp. CBMAI 1063]|nr:unnamed protein product [Peniophora sp. CBMAI 1063]
MIGHILRAFIGLDEQLLSLSSTAPWTSNADGRGDYYPGDSGPYGSHSEGAGEFQPSSRSSADGDILRHGANMTPPTSQTQAAARGEAVHRDESTRRMPGAYPNSFRSSVKRSSVIRRDASWFERRRAEDNLARALREERLSRHKKYCRGCKCRKALFLKPGACAQLVPTPDDAALSLYNAVLKEKPDPKQPDGNRRREAKDGRRLREKDGLGGNHSESGEEERYALEAAFDLYIRKWDEIRSGRVPLDSIEGEDLPWPVRDGTTRLQSLDAINKHNIASFVLHPLRPDFNDKSPRQRIKEELTRWHSDKFNTIVLPLVLPQHKEEVKALANEVTIHLNEILRSI